jgi:murein DD-endopeptidase MepM/ murein hydrolase activator NlpD
MQARQLPIPGGTIADGFLTTRANHWAWDVAGKGGATVVAPESGVVVDVYSSPDPQRKDNTSMKGQTALTKATYPGIADPWNGYGPGGVLLRGDSGVWHLLAHLATTTVGVGDRVSGGAVVGTLPQHVGASGPHTHWEVRTKALSTLGDRAQTSLNPGDWLRGQADNNQPRAPQRGARPGTSAVIIGIGAGLVVLGIMSSRVGRHGLA